MNKPKRYMKEVARYHRSAQCSQGSLSLEGQFDWHLSSFSVAAEERLAQRQQRPEAERAVGMAPIILLPCHLSGGVNYFESSS